MDEVVVALPGRRRGGTGDSDAGTLGRVGAVLQAAGLSGWTWAAPSVGSPGAHLEVITIAEADRLLGNVADAIGMSLAADPAWVVAPPRQSLRTAHMDASLEPVARLLTELVERHGVSGHKWSVRRHILESLPAWARERAEVDDIGNIMVEAGPERDTTVFMAHQDEVGYAVESIGSDWDRFTLARRWSPELGIGGANRPRGNSSTPR